MADEKYIKALRDVLETLPKGYVSRKLIRGKETFYLQWREGRKVRSKYIKKDDVEGLREEIRRRHAIQEELVKTEAASKAEAAEWDVDFESDVKYGSELFAFAHTAEKWECRDALKNVMWYLRGDSVDRVMILYGLRRSGKTTMLKQAICQLSQEEFEKSAYIKVSSTQEIAELGRDLEKLQRRGVRYVFIDEVTLLSDFVMGSALLSDIYAGMGMKVVLSGTDSLGFWLSLKDELYDRAFMVHTTFIPFREHSRLLKVDDVDEYIRYGGTLRMGTRDLDNPAAFAADASFRDDETTRVYVDTAIASNIQHSLKFADDGRYFGGLYKLYEAGELTNAINRLIEDMNHKFLVEVVTRNFVSNDLGSVTQLEKKGRHRALRSEILKAVDKASITNRLMDTLDIVNKERQKVEVTPAHLAEIRYYLKVLDLLTECEIRSSVPTIPTEIRVLFTQPGMRFAQAQALIHSLNKDGLFLSQSDTERFRICRRIEQDVMGRMLEDIVLCETIRAIPYKRDKYGQLQVFKLTFERGEFDMVIFDPENLSCRLFEVKHTSERDDGQIRHLTDPEKLAWAERNYGKILSRTVLYRGDPYDHPTGVAYRNVGDYLKNLQGSPSFQ